MSNTKNLASLAAVLDDGSSGQVLQSTGSGGVQFADSSGSGVTVHANQAAMLTDAASSDEGTLHYETGTNKLYVKQTSGFYLLASITNASPTIDSFSEATGGASANNLTAGGTFELTSGSNTVITINATEPDLETISYSATVTSGTATDVFSSPSFPVSNQSSNVFTLTPVTSGIGGTVTIRFDASDGTNVANVSHSFEIAFSITDSHYTSLLMATDGSAGNNQDDISDSSSNDYTITVAGDTHAGTFSPYRHGGYSTYFDGSNDYLAVTKSTDLDLDTNNWTIECWLNLTNPSAAQAVYSFGYETQTTRGYIIYLLNGNLHFAYSTNGSNNTDTSMGSHGITANEWAHLSVVKNGSTITGYINGSALGTTINIGSSDIYYPSSGNVRIGGDGTNFVTGYISDFRLVNGTAITPASGGPTERLTAVTNTKLLTCHLPYIADGSSSDHSITINGNIETRPFGPYDYDEYDESINGGSIHHSGAGGNYLSLPTAPTIGTSEFEISMWLYPETKASDDVIIDFRPAGTNGTYINFLLTGGVPNLNVNGAAINGSLADELPTKIWSYLTLTRVSGSTKLYINGTQTGNTYSDTNNYLTGSNRPIIAQAGYTTSSTLGFNGYMSDLIIKLSGNSSPSIPTAPVSSSGTALHIKGIDAHVLDKSQGNNLKLVNDATASTTGKFSNTGSVYFDGTGDNVVIAASPQINFGSEDYTLEFWINFAALPSNGYILNKEDSNGNDFTLQYYQNAIKASNATVGSSWNHYSTGIGSLSINTWYHIAYVRSGGTLKSYKDGVEINSATDSRNYNLDNAIVVGSRYANDYGANFYMQDLRISVGKARYTSNNFTVPQAPLKG